MKKCCKCKKDLDLSKFTKNKTAKDGLNRNCYYCQRDYTKTHYNNNKEYYKNKARKRSKKFREWYLKLKLTFKCSKCDESHPACLDFHHLEKKDKLFEICDAVMRGNSKSKILDEMSKCRVLCSNCHRKEHYYADTNSIEIISSRISADDD